MPVTRRWGSGCELQAERESRDQLHFLRSLWLRLLGLQGASSRPCCEPAQLFFFCLTMGLYLICLGVKAAGVCAMPETLLGSRVYQWQDNSAETVVTVEAGGCCSTRHLCGWLSYLAPLEEALWLSCLLQNPLCMIKSI